MRRLRAGYYQAAVRDFSAAITLDPDHWTAYFRRAEAYRNLGLEEQARADLEKTESLIMLYHNSASRLVPKRRTNKVRKFTVNRLNWQSRLVGGGRDFGEVFL